jgi:hypothetical protein
MAGLADGVIDRLVVDPAGFPGTLFESGSLGLGECSSERSHVKGVSGSVGRLSCSVAEASLGSAAIIGGVGLPGSHSCVCV